MKTKCSACGAINPSARHSFTPLGDGSTTLAFCGVTGQAAVAEDLPPDNRIDRSELFMRTALLFARRGSCPRAQVGAVIVRDRRIISTGYNGSPVGAAHCIEVGCLEGPDGGCLRTTHAELNAILWAARTGISTREAVMYCTHEPCLTCAKAIATAGIAALTFLHPYRLHDGITLLDALHIPIRQLELDDVES